MNTVSFNFDLTKENESLITKVTKVAIGGQVSEPKADTKETAETEKPTSEKINTEGKAAATMTPADFKKAAKACKDTHGEDFAKSVLKTFEVPPAPTLVKNLKDVPKHKYEDIVAAWVAGPTENEDDDFGEDETPANIEPDAVKTALKAYAKSESKEAAKDLMKKHGVKGLPAIAEASQEVLAAILKEIA